VRSFIDQNYLYVISPFVGFLASDASEWVDGQIIRVNGGYILFLISCFD
jgi:NAD(P)-dependent dehydrogenase (short-subunit alcohol dehydrogenase family)